MGIARLALAAVLLRLALFVAAVPIAENESYEDLMSVEPQLNTDMQHEIASGGGHDKRMVITPGPPKIKRVGTSGTSGPRTLVMTKTFCVRF
jgi:hypothetical protein